MGAEMSGYFNFILSLLISVGRSLERGMGAWQAVRRAVISNPEHYQLSQLSLARVPPMCACQCSLRLGGSLAVDGYRSLEAEMHLVFPRETLTTPLCKLRGSFKPLPRSPWKIVARTRVLSQCCLHWSAPSREGFVSKCGSFNETLPLSHIIHGLGSLLRWDFQNSALGLISGLVLLRNLKPTPGEVGSCWHPHIPTFDAAFRVLHFVSCFFLDEPLDFSLPHVPNFAEKEWWCFCITEKLSWVVINDWHVWVFREEISLGLLLCEIIVFRMACEKFLQIYFIFSWYPSSSLFLCPKCNYKMFP